MEMDQLIPLLKVSFSANSFPAEVQFGDPWVDPYANLDSSAFGTITGSVQDTEGNHLDEFDIWFFKTSGGDASNDEADEDDDVVFIVAGGDLSYPYYNITLESNGASVDFQSYALIKGKSYTFKAGDISPSHPFNIGSSFQNNSPQATGGPLDQNSQATNQSITVSIPADFEGSLSYFCTIHQSMMHQFIISDPSPEDNIGNNPDLGGENFDIYADEPVFFQLEYGENGTFTAKLPAGNYHAEAVAYDPETDTAYKPQIYGGFENPTIFEIDGNESSYSDINFALEAEFRMSYEFAEVQGIVQTTSDTDERIEVFFDLFPVDDAGQRLTDYPVHSFGVNRDGEIRAHIPIGTFEVEVFSPDNSWSLAQSLPPITIEPGTNILDPITLAARDLVVLSGSISDAVSGEGIWADVIFVDPNDDMVQFWPEWVHDEGVEPPAPGSFSVRIPAGSYLKRPKDSMVFINLLFTMQMAMVSRIL